MKKLIFPLVAVALAVVACGDDDSTSPEVTPGHAVIANRGSGTISVINANTLEVQNFGLPAREGDSPPEPMYVVHVATLNRVFVGDRANNRVVAFDDETFEEEGTVDAGNGVFHMWADPLGDQLWVNNDVDNTTTVIDPASLTVIATVPTPADLVAMGGKPHDVIVGPNGHYAYISVVGLDSDDYVVQFDTGTFVETARATGGKDSHLSLAEQHNWLYVPSQNTGEVLVMDRSTLALSTTIEVPGAHGAGMSNSGEYFYTTNLPGGGTDGLYTIATSTNTLVGDPTDCPYAVPHNVVLSSDDRQLFVTHSGGTSDKVTVYEIDGADPTPTYVGEVTVGLNPFGLAFVP